jgi:hypothetical protein
MLLTLIFNIIVNMDICHFFRSDNNPHFTKVLFKTIFYNIFNVMTLFSFLLSNKYYNHESIKIILTYKNYVNS